MPDVAPPLTGLRVVESAAGLAATYAGFLLAGLGAEVVSVARPGTERRAPGDRVLARGKRSVVLDTERAADAACWRALAAGTDVLLSDEGGLAASPDAERIECRVSAWGGASALPPDEALVAAATGIQALQWSWARRPVWLVTPVVGYMTGILAALGVTAAFLARRRGAPATRLSVSGIGGAFALNSGTYVTGMGREYEGSLSRHGDPRGVYPTYALYETADGWLFVGALTQTFWVKLMTVLGREDLLAHPSLQVNPLAFGAPAVRDLVRAELEPMFRTRTTADWVEHLRAGDVPCGPVQTRAEFLNDPDARALGLAVPIDDPLLGPTWQAAAPAAFSDTPAPQPSPAPPPGADTETVRGAVAGWRRAVARRSASPSAAPLAGVRVVDLTSFIAGPFCPMLLADLGADVVKVEAPEGDPFRMAAFGFVGWNRGKRSLVLDLKRPEGSGVLLDLVRAADVLVDNFRAGVLERLDLGWERLAAANPRLVHTSITGFGSSGPLATLPGFDPVFQARSGLAQAQGGSDAPVLHMVAYNDYCAGALGALATVAALAARERTGRGQRVDVSLFRTAFVAQAAHAVLSRGGTPGDRGGRDHLGPAAGRRLYACADGWLCVAAGTPGEVSALGKLAGVVLGSDDSPDGPGAAAVAAILASLTRASALARLADAGVPAAPCRTLEDLFADSGLVASGAIVEQAHPVLGTVRMAGSFVSFAPEPVPLGRTAPLLGEHGAELLAEIGYTSERVAALVAAGVVGRPR
jgi:crotonobetainyl-CoA:carnitine CoA-transferase CaiB-like acyl-CoA transferase